MSLTYRVCVFLFLIYHIHAADFAITLDPEEKYHVSWSHEGTAPSDDITFTVSCQTTGWVGLGFSPSGSMAGADIVVMWVDANNKAHIKDMHALANYLPKEDASQDYTLISSNQNNGISSFSFKRKIDTCDKESDNVILTSTTKLIYAYGTSDPTGDNLEFKDIHSASHRGVKSIYLLDLQNSPNALPNDTLTFDLTVDNIELPATDTTYYCSFHEAPKVASRSQIIAVEPVVQSGNEGFVHHIIVYACYNISQNHLQNITLTGGICRTAEMPEYWNSCRHIIYAWAVGGTKYYFPEETGFGFGDEDSPQYFFMETHYDNQMSVAGIRDSSGMRLTYTSQPRQYEAGNMAIGIVEGIFVPPQANDFKVVAYCHSSCTQQWIPEGGVTVFGYLLHAHLLGVAIKLELYRDNKPLEIFAQDKNYDFNYQEQRSFVPYKKLLPGDSLKITCTYDSTKRLQMTYGGEGTLQEMCLTFLMYYPKQQISTCGSLPGFVADRDDSLYTRLSLDVDSAKIPTYNGSVNSFYNYPKLLSNISDWTAEKVSLAQESVLESWPNVYCYLDPSLEYYQQSNYSVDPADFTEIAEASNDYCNAANVRSSSVTSQSSIPTTPSSASYPFTSLLLAGSAVCLLFLF